MINAYVLSCLNSFEDNYALSPRSQELSLGSSCCRSMLSVSRHLDIFPSLYFSCIYLLVWCDLRLTSLCWRLQEECLREESRYHSLNCLVSIARIKLDRAEQEKKWQEGNGRMLRDFASFKDLYSVCM